MYQVRCRYHQATSKRFTGLQSRRLHKAARA
nr:MAG TPA: hypothetical protein [Caudoviricetes sp.]